MPTEVGNMLCKSLSHGLAAEHNVCSGQENLRGMVQVLVQLEPALAIASAPS